MNTKTYLQQERQRQPVIFFSQFSLDLIILVERQELQESIELMELLVC